MTNKSMTVVLFMGYCSLITKLSIWYQSTVKIGHCELSFIRKVVSTARKTLIIPPATWWTPCQRFYCFKWLIHINNIIFNWWHCLLKIETFNLVGWTKLYCHIAVVTQPCMQLLDPTFTASLYEEPLYTLQQIWNCQSGQD